jgi:uncharacterized protein (TIGR00730 family)
MDMDQKLSDNRQKLLLSPSYRIAYQDQDFLETEMLRSARIELEMLKAELAFEKNKINSTIVVFGSTQVCEPAEAQRRLDLARARLSDTPDDVRRHRAVDRAERILAKSEYYNLAYEFSKLVSSECQKADELDYVIVTGGGPGIMEAANRGAYDVDAKSVGLNIKLPREQAPNPYITPELCFQFHYFAIRKLHFLLRARGVVVFPGGYGTMDELFEALTLRQTGRMQDLPIVMFNREYWESVIDFQFLADEGTIDDEDLDLFRFADTPEEAWQMIHDFHE